MEKIEYTMISIEEKQVMLHLIKPKTFFMARLMIKFILCLKESKVKVIFKNDRYLFKLLRE